ncbi:MAG: hypothetical protein MZV65_22090 [Chromatiales bacterium]|nr:hypothetical protein [Chromatiales bacterium]
MDLIVMGHRGTALLSRWLIGLGGTPGDRLCALRGDGGALSGGGARSRVWTGRAGAGTRPRLSGESPVPRGRLLLLSRPSPGGAESAGHLAGPWALMPRWEGRFPDARPSAAWLAGFDPPHLPFDGLQSWSLAQRAR